MNDDHLARQVIDDIAKKKSAFWERQREKNALALFHRAAQEVPAYKDFLKKNHINVTKIKTFADFQQVPTIDKKNYLRQYPLEKLVWGGTLKREMVFTATSGSTGAPFYFPRGLRLDWEGSIIHEMFLQNAAAKQNGSTLVLVCFGMGVWIGGLLTYKGYEIAARRGGYPISILTPGINKKEIFNALRALAPQFAQTILIGYPPFIKDIIDGAKIEGIDITKLNLRLSFAAEAFTENFRDYLVKNAGVEDLYRDTINIYGSADIGAMGFETPQTILIRRLAYANASRKAFGAIFGDIKKTPTLAQYNPSFITFESLEGNLCLTGNNAIPLVRYLIGDRGGIMSHNEMNNRLQSVDIDLGREVKQKRWINSGGELPFVYVYERADFSTTLYGLQIYPEHIREALIKGSISKLVTGKFAMSNRFDRNQDQYLEINLETRPKVTVDEATKVVVAKTVVAHLEKVNSEFRELHRFLGKRAIPRLIFWPHEDSKYFLPGIKQRWSVQTS